MTDVSKITPGPWVVDARPDGIHIRPQGQGFIIAFIDNDWLSSNVLPIQTNAELIAEAGTVAHETGLSPRQLAEQREELLSALEEYVDDDDVSEGEGCGVYGKETKQRIRDLIAKCRSKP